MTAAGRNGPHSDTFIHHRCVEMKHKMWETFWSNGYVLMPREWGCLWHSKRPICATPMHHWTSQQSLFFKTSTITAGKHASACSGKPPLTISRASAKYKACLLSSPRQEFKNEGDFCNHYQQDKGIDTDNTRSSDVTYLDARRKSIKGGQEWHQRQITSSHCGGHFRQQHMSIRDKERGV